MDLQYVTNAFVAVMYVMSYSQLLGQIGKECEDTDIKEQIKSNQHFLWKKRSVDTGNCYTSIVSVAHKEN